MDEETFKEKTALLLEIGSVVAKLPPEIRSQAFDLLKGYVSAHERSSRDSEAGKSRPRDDDALNGGIDDKEQFFTSFEHDKPADNVKLVIAYLFSQFGSQPFKAEEVQGMADEVGVTVPSRIDMTIRMATADGKRLFASAGRGLFKPTVHGEAYLKEQYKIKKGTRQKPEQPEA